MSEPDVFKSQVAFNVFFVLEVLVVLYHVLHSIVHVIDVVLLPMRQELSGISVLVLVAKLPDFPLADEFVVIDDLLLLGVSGVKPIIVKPVVEKVGRVAEVET